LNGTLWTK